MYDVVRCTSYKPKGASRLYKSVVHRFIFRASPMVRIYTFMTVPNSTGVELTSTAVLVDDSGSYFHVYKYDVPDMTKELIVHSTSYNALRDTSTYVYVLCTSTYYVHMYK